MTGLRIRIDIPDRLRRFASRLPNLGEDVITVAAETVREQTVHRFSTKRPPDGGTWKPSPNSMQDTGNLMDNIRRIVHGTTARVGPTVVYGPIHQFGGTINTRRASGIVIPARPYLGVNSRDSREIEKRVAGVVRALLR